MKGGWRRIARDKIAQTRVGWAIRVGRLGSDVLLAAGDGFAGRGSDGARVEGGRGGDEDVVGAKGFGERSLTTSFELPLFVAVTVAHRHGVRREGEKEERKESMSLRPSQAPLRLAAPICCKEG
jgi:hypothetical protein